MDSNSQDKFVQLGHGGGGTLQDELIQFITKNIPLKRIGDGIGVDAYDDGATIPLDDSDQEIVVTADGHTVDPIIFPGGDLGKLSVCGTVNDLIMMGATPLALTSVILVEEGTEFAELGHIVDSFNAASKEAGIAILAGDTKVMPKGTLKGIVISTSGIGIRPKSRNIADANCEPGSKIILTGSIGDHGAALYILREGIEIESELTSDVAHLSQLVPIIAGTDGILAMKDPTRGGVSSALNEWARKSNVGIEIEQSAILIKKEVRAISEILGFEPLEIANEGKALICVKAEVAEEVLAKIKATAIGKDARIIGEVTSDHPQLVLVKTPLGGKRILEKPYGEILPRIC